MIEKQPYKEKNEITRHFEKIWDDNQDPDVKELKRINKIRAERLDHSDQGL